jgi:hypothetical protein
MVVTIVDLFDKPEPLLGKVVTITGKLICRGDGSSFLAPDYARFARGERAFINDSGVILTHLRTSLPGSGGGKVVFCVDAVLTATIVRSNGSFELIDIISCTAAREEYKVEISF